MARRRNGKMNSRLRASQHCDITPISLGTVNVSGVDANCIRFSDTVNLKLAG